MEKHTAILVLGDPGPVRQELLARGDVETLWVSHASDVLAVLREGRPAVCLVSADLPSDEVQRVLEQLAAHGRIPAILLVDPYGTSIDPRLAARAAAIVPHHRADSILALVSLHTGLSFTRDPRADIEALVRVYLDEEEYVLETSNLSVSNVTIRNFPPVREGTMVYVELELSGVTVIAEARVIAFAEEDGLPAATLSFVRINRAQRERIMRVVESVRRASVKPKSPVHELFEDLTADLGAVEALKTSDIVPEELRSSIDLCADHELDQLRAWMDTDARAHDAPEWLTRVSQEMTAIERLAVRGGDVPAWVSPALKMRLCLARARFASSPGSGDLILPDAPKIPSTVADEAYRMFVRLGTEQAAAPDALVAQISRIRAALLRDLLAAGPRPKSERAVMLDEVTELEPEVIPRRPAPPASVTLTPF
ncbi:PilZ domain-containing protein [Myxococcota bacterium]|nr:PilZ domain-containing protein [Myxococcota bacterium]